MSHYLFGNESASSPRGEGTPTIQEMHLTLPGLVSHELRLIFQWLLFTGLAMSIAVLGIVANIINVICFVKQGLKDSVNVSLLGLAVSDLGCLITTLGNCISFTPPFQEADLPFDTIEIGYLVTAWPHIIFARITTWITAIVTLERCLCISMPLKVKNIITSNRVTVVIVCIFVVFICSIIPMYYANRAAIVFSPERNRTILGLVYTDDRPIVEQISFAINNVLLPFAAFLTIIICTITLVVKLRNKAKWRLKSTAPEKAGTLSDRDQKVSQMVVMISSLFIACFTPLSFMFLGMILEPEFAVTGRYKNLLFVMGGVISILESTNSASNIFIYYRMSSRYRAVFRQLFLPRLRKTAKPFY